VRYLLAYLGRYTHRVAISNERIVSLDQGTVQFRWKDYADGHRVKVMALDAEEFIRGFLLHVVPDGFVRIRHFGLLANRTRRAKLDRCRRLLEQPPAPEGTDTESARALMLRLTGIDIERCPVCQRGRLLITEILPPAPDPARPAPVWDTS
jgi:hypothetical protein